MLTDNQMAQPQKPPVAEQQIVSLGRILQNLREEDNIEGLVQSIISYIQEQFDYSLIWIALYERLEHILYGKGGITPGKDTQYLTQRWVISPGDLLEQVVIEQRPLGVVDLRAENRAEGWQEVAKQYRIQGTILLPIRYKDRCMGLIMLGSERWGFSQLTDEKNRLSIVLGELGAVLYHKEIDLLYRQAKRPEEPILEVLENFKNLSNLEQKFETVVKAVHEFITPHRTSIYWLENEGQYFWRRVSYQAGKLTNNANSYIGKEIKVQEFTDFYYALAINEIVSIGEARSSLKSNFTAQLLQRLQLRSLLAVPIVWQKDLLGFLAVESKEPRIWNEADRSFLKVTAGFISLVLPCENMEKTISQIETDAELKAQVAKSIYSETDYHQIFNSSAVKVLEIFQASRFFVLKFDPEENCYQILYQSYAYNRRPLNLSFDTLKDVDLELLQNATEAVGIESLENDLRFYNWSRALYTSDARSLLVCNCSPGKKPQDLLIITHDKYRAWTSREKQLLQQVSQQLGVVIRQWELNKETQQQQQILKTFQESIRILEQVQNTTTHQGEISTIERLEQTALQLIGTITASPLVLLVSWQHGENIAQIIPGVMNNSRFAISSDYAIPVSAEALIQWAHSEDGIVEATVDDLPSGTKKWLNASGIGQVLIMALRTSIDYKITGIVVIADHRERSWSEQTLKATETLIYQLAWSRRHWQITNKLQSHNNKLLQLNWYKQRRSEDIYRQMTQHLSQIHNMGFPKDDVGQIRLQQVLRQLDNTATSMNKMLKSEEWKLSHYLETMPITSLLKRVLDRVDILIKQQKLWLGIHGISQESKSSNSSIVISGDISKIELVIYELLLSACSRSSIGGRIDIWCRPLEEQFLEISITDNGSINQQMLSQLQEDKSRDELIPSILDKPPGLYLFVCQNLIENSGGKLHFYQLPDNRFVSRLLLSLPGG
jgi:GAF domain-containing protein